MSNWITIDRLGTLGMEPDLMPVHRDPASLDFAVNVRNIGPNLANAGGYTAVQNGNFPEEVTPTNCACPDEFHDFSVQDGETHVDRSWLWDWNQAHYSLSAIPVNLDGREYDLAYRYGQGECNTQRLAGDMIEVLNTPAARKVRLVTLDTAGAVLSTWLDYDASVEFGDGLIHWVIVEEYIDSSRRTFSIHIDDTQLFRNNTDTQILGDWVHVVRSNSPGGFSIPIAFWTGSTSLFDCLTSGSYTGLGRCARINQDNALRFDQSISDVDLDLYLDNRIVTPKLGVPSRRAGYLDTLVLSGKIYFEIARGTSSSIATACHNDPGFVFGGVERGTLLGSSSPGTIANSWGHDPGGNIVINGVVQGPGFVGENLRYAAAIDLDTGDTWFGVDNGTSISWLNDIDPTQAAEWNLYTGGSAYDMILCISLNDQTDAVKILSSADSVRYAAPAGFGYIKE